MYAKDNEIAFGVLNAVIFNLYIRGEHRAAELTERERDKEAMETYDKALKAYKERQVVYNSIERSYAASNRDGDTPQDRIKLISKIKQLPILAKVYFIFVCNPVKLKQIEEVGTLYNRVVYSYLYKFEGWREENTFDVDSLGDIRAAFSSIERCIRFIKQDKPEIFNMEIIKEANQKEAETRDQFGNNVVGL